MNRRERIERFFSSLLDSAYENQGEILCGSFIAFLCGHFGAVFAWALSMWLVLGLSLAVGIMAAVVFLASLIYFSFRDKQVEQKSREIRANRLDRAMQQIQ